MQNTRITSKSHQETYKLYTITSAMLIRLPKQHAHQIFDYDRITKRLKMGEQTRREQKKHELTRTSGVTIIYK